MQQRRESRGGANLSSAMKVKARDSGLAEARAGARPGLGGRAAHRRPIRRHFVAGFEWERGCCDPKDGELCLSRAKPCMLKSLSGSTLECAICKIALSSWQLILLRCRSFLALEKVYTRDSTVVYI